MDGPRASVLTEHRAADRRRKSELVRVGDPPSDDGALKQGSVTRTMDGRLLNSRIRSPLHD